MSRRGASHLLDLSGGLIAASLHEDGGVVAQSMTKDPQTDEVRPMPTVPHSDQLRNPLLAEDFHFTTSLRTKCRKRSTEN